MDTQVPPNGVEGTVLHAPRSSDNFFTRKVRSSLASFPFLPEICTLSPGLMSAQGSEEFAALTGAFSLEGKAARSSGGAAREHMVMANGEIDSEPDSHADTGYYRGNARHRALGLAIINRAAQQERFRG